MINWEVGWLVGVCLTYQRTIEIIGRVVSDSDVSIMNVLATWRKSGRKVSIVKSLSSFTAIRESYKKLVLIQS